MNAEASLHGYFDERANSAPQTDADRMKHNAHAICACTPIPPQSVALHGCRLTQSEDGKRPYVRVIEYPFAFLEL